VLTENPPGMYLPHSSSADLLYNSTSLDEILYTQTTARPGHIDAPRAVEQAENAGLLNDKH